MDENELVVVVSEGEVFGWVSSWKADHGHFLVLCRFSYCSNWLAEELINAFVNQDVNILNQLVTLATIVTFVEGNDALQDFQPVDYKAKLFKDAAAVGWIRSEDEVTELIQLLNDAMHMCVNRSEWPAP